MIQVDGLGGSWSTNPNGMRMVWQGQDAMGNTLYSRQRDTSQFVYGTILATGDVDAPALVFQITLQNVAPAGVVARLYFSAATLPDSWYDSALYGPAFVDALGHSAGMECMYAIPSTSIGAGATVGPQALPSYRGACQIGAAMTQAGHIAIVERDYTGSLLRQALSIPISNSGAGSILTPWYPRGLYNLILIQNDSASAGTFNIEINTLDDLV